MKMDATGEMEEMFHEDRASSRPKSPHLPMTPTSPESHLTERAERTRRIRRGRLLDDLYTTGWARAERGDLLGALRCYEDVLRIDGDSYHAWLALSIVFRRMEDSARADRCLGVARRLARSAASSPHTTA